MVLLVVEGLFFVRFYILGVVGWLYGTSSWFLESMVGSLVGRENGDVDVSSVILSVLGYVF